MLGQDLASSEYGWEQWCQAVGVARCKLCVNEGLQNADRITERQNLADHNTFEHEPSMQGAFRWVAKGTYDRGCRQVVQVRIGVRVRILSD
jgi:hypothetical protein